MWLFWIILFIVGLSFYIYYSTKKRRENLMLKYQNEELVDMIMSGKYWQGQTEEQLRDSLGKPLDIDQKVLKTKTKEIWKYNQTAKNRYSLKIILEDGFVVGWDIK
ncbi:hypothetical protein [Sulfuricurvum sp.]|uniref:hypothetical protein n=1 Tax=Sulfuricurvum sp. TaxID=2025608 RepID=UPI00286E328F|nr:hypothetical protein [Sulfuricurvum sp.]